MMKLIPVNEIIENELTRLGLNLLIKIHPEKVEEQAVSWENIEEFKIPMIGGMTELETLLFNWVAHRRKQQATKIHLAELSLANAMIEELDIPETDTQLAIATCLKWVSGDTSGQYRFLKWLVEHSPDVEAIVSLSSDWTWDYCRLLNASVFLGCRLDPTRDWTSDLLMRRNLLSDIESLIKVESGEVTSTVNELDLEDKEDLKKP